jgi:uncharacterized membrane-anchored protein
LRPRPIARRPLSEEQRRSELTAAWQAGERAGTKGPAEVTLIDQASLQLPADHFYIPKPEGTRIMRALGNTVGDNKFLGLIVGTKPSDQWIVVTQYIKDGYIKDDEAKDWNADRLLQSLKDGTEEANKDRAARGFAEVEVLGWVEKPSYEPVTHRLVWSALLRTKGEPDSTEKGINYNTYAKPRPMWRWRDRLSARSAQLWSICGPAQAITRCCWRSPMRGSSSTC